MATILARLLQRRRGECGAKRQAVVLRRGPFRAALLILAVVAFALGCESRLSEPPSTQAVPAESDPEIELSRVLDRLEYALQSARASQESGVSSVRRCSVKHLQPDADHPRRRAAVTIVTEVTLLQAPRPAKKDVDPIASAEAASEKSLHLQQAKERDRYLLEYKEGRWRLLTDPARETDAVCWQYALAQ